MDFQLTTDNKEVLIEMPSDVQAFFNNGNVIPGNVGSIYFMPFAFERFGNTNCFRVLSMDEAGLDNIGLNMYRKLTEEEFKEKYPSYDSSAL